MQSTLRRFFGASNDTGSGNVGNKGNTSSTSTTGTISVASTSTAPLTAEAASTTAAETKLAADIDHYHNHEQPQKKSRVSSVVQELLDRSADFELRHQFPVRTNLIATQLEQQAEIEVNVEEFIAEAAQGTMPLLHDHVWDMLQWFIEHKKSQGSTVEVPFYSNVCTTPHKLLVRLLEKRPIMFMTSADSSVLRDGQRLSGGFTKIGRDMQQPPLVLEDYISYDEMQLSAMVNMFVPTMFINDGARNNRGKPGAPGTFQRTGVYVGMVGARFERPGYMEWQHMVVDSNFATTANGFGLANLTENTPLATKQRKWAEFYDFKMMAADGSLVHCLPTYDEAHGLAVSGDDRFLSLGTNEQYLNVAVYKARLRMILEPFLLHANEYARMQNKRAWLHVVGLGLGVWALADNQAIFMLEVYDEILSQIRAPHISDIVFGYFPAYANRLGTTRHGGVYDKNGNSIRVAFSRARNPAQPVEEGKVLIAQYAWDGNSYPGNEYWIGALTASGDPAAAACSLIPELQNPEINPYMTQTAALWPSQRIETLS